MSFATSHGSTLWAHCNSALVELSSFFPSTAYSHVKQRNQKSSAVCRYVHTFLLYSYCMDALLITKRSLLMDLSTQSAYGR